VALIDWDSPEVLVKMQAALLGLNRTSLYYQPVAVSAEELAIKRRIDEIYTAWPFYGSPRITAQMNREGWGVNHKRIERYLREMGLAAICPGPNLSKRKASEGVWPYLLRDAAIVRPNQVFGIDITYVRLRQSWMYLVAILDWYSRYVVAWELDETLEMPFVLYAVDRALACAVPDIVNSVCSRRRPGRAARSMANMEQPLGYASKNDLGGRAFAFPHLHS
jgi:putative transposase